MQNKARYVLDVPTSKSVEFIDVTGAVSDIVGKSGVKDGVCVLFVPHTTAGITINENADPDVVSDIIGGLSKAVPESSSYRHGEGNSPAHIKSSLIGVSKNIFIEDGRLVLGTWQGIYFAEFDGPRARKLWIKIIGA